MTRISMKLPIYSIFKQASHHSALARHFVSPCIGRGFLCVQD
jgi:hypothetical protein